MAQFSGAVKLADLNDFIAPSQACVVTMSGDKVAELPSDDVLAAGSVQLQQRAPLPPQGGFAQTREAGPDGAVKVTLHDCLACSGCVTSAETVLLEHQSAGEFLARLASPGVAVVVSISPQSRAALAALHGLPPAAAQARLAAFLKALGVRMVLDASAGRDLALLEAAAEFVARYRAVRRALPGDAKEASARERAASGAAAGPSGRPPVPGVVSVASGTLQRGRSPGSEAGSEAGFPGPLPMLASACPGWVCYAEKTHGEYALPYISTAKSPQAVMGTVVKRHLAARLGHAPADIHHVAIMPCYDKKLEASRGDFNLPGTAVPEVDVVLTTGEVQRLLEERGVSLAALPEVQLDDLASGAPERGRVYGYPGGAGGYLEYVFRTAARELFGASVPSMPLPLRQLRNADFREVVLEVDGRPALRFAAAYGFRNIQTLVRKIKRRACEYDYVEVMACPSACLNGGGQLPPTPGQSPQQLLEQLEQLYHDPQVEQREPSDSPAARALYAGWVGGLPGSAAARRLLHTGYHRREKPAAAAAADW
ncbi:hypothetical protein WJX81_001163 [Elliptochloris bilobata]|uniref:Iron hydrogenase small subunit domain-containing protein n=1 Tax=Elliptochloris bilobata TaxID=381761 RepID=A0AAW1QZ38_9CHLO